MSGRWLLASLAVPAFRFSSAEFRVLCRLRASLPFQNSHRDITPEFLIDSRNLAADSHIKAHNALRDWLIELIKSFGFHVYKENESRLHLVKVPDFYCPSFPINNDEGNNNNPPVPTVFDVTICHPGCNEFCNNHADTIKGAAAARDIAMKLREYRTSINDRPDLSFFVLSFETHGYLPSGTRKFIRILADCLRRKTGALPGQASSFLFTKLICFTRKLFACRILRKYAAFIDAESTHNADGYDPLVYIPPLEIANHSFTQLLNDFVNDRTVVV